MNKQPSLYLQLLSLAYKLSQAVSKHKVTVDNHDGTMYSNDKTDVDDYSLRDAVAIIDLSIFDGLQAHSIKYLLNVIKGMKRNNVFYQVKETTANERRSIAELKRRDILIPTERTELYIINPFKIRRGKPLSTIMASLHYFNKDNDILRIENLRPPKQAAIGR